MGLLKAVGIGDMVLVSAVASDIMKAFPDAELVIFAGEDNLEVAQMVDGARAEAISMADPLGAVRLLRQERLDVLVDFGQWSRIEALCAGLSGACYIVGFRTHGQGRHYAFDAAVDHAANIHELENYRRLVLVTLGVRGVTAPALRSSAACDPPFADPYVVFHPWASGFRSELKEWSEERWIDLAQELSARGYGIVVTGSAADWKRSEDFAERCKRRVDRVENVSDRYSIRELVTVLRRAQCVVSVNTGVMHLAAAAGARTVALNGPTAAQRWGPVGDRVVSVDSDLPGCGYLSLGFEYDGNRHDCMDGIHPASVIRALDGLLARA